VKHAKEFFAYARKREGLRMRTEMGKPAPWTRDPILRQYRFCNVFREDDKVTRWFRDNIRGKLDGDAAVLWATICFRWFNRPTTGERLIDSGLLFKWDAPTARKALGDLKPLVTGAFMVKTPAGKSKLEGLIEVLTNVWRWRDPLHEGIVKHPTLEEAHARLCAFPYMGAFMAYEVVTDLRHTHLLRDALDIMTWASAGPGAFRGAGRVLHGDHTCFRRGNHADEVAVLGYMRHLLDLSNESKYWPKEWPVWEMREVEHTLCEFDKYERARLGQGRPKQLYKGADHVHN
jgi:hypothetical protein